MIPVSIVPSSMPADCGIQIGNVQTKTTTGQSFDRTLKQAETATRRTRDDRSDTRREETRTRDAATASAGVSKDDVEPKAESRNADRDDQTTAETKPDARTRETANESSSKTAQTQSANQQARPAVQQSTQASQSSDAVQTVGQTVTLVGEAVSDVGETVAQAGAEVVQAMSPEADTQAAALKNVPAAIPSDLDPALKEAILDRIATQVAEQSAKVSSSAQATAAVIGSSESKATDVSSVRLSELLSQTDKVNVRVDTLDAKNAESAKQQTMIPRDKVIFTASSDTSFAEVATRSHARSDVRASQVSPIEVAAKSVSDGLSVRSTPVAVDTAGSRVAPAHAGNDSQSRQENAADRSRSDAAQGEQEEAEARTKSEDEVRRPGATRKSTETPAADSASASRRGLAKEFGFQETLKETAGVQARQAAQAPQRPAPAWQNQSTIFQQVQEKLQLGIKQGGGKVDMTLHPESLGRVQVHIRVEDGVMKTVLVADDAAVRDVLLNQQNDLKASLAQHGVKVGEFSVLLSNDGQGGAWNSDNPSGSTRGEGSQSETEVQSEAAEAIPRRSVNPDAIVDLVV